MKKTWDTLKMEENKILYHIFEKSQFFKDDNFSLIYYWY